MIVSQILLLKKSRKDIFVGNYGYLNVNQILEITMQLVLFSLDVIIVFWLCRKMSFLRDIFGVEALCLQFTWEWFVRGREIYREREGWREGEDKVKANLIK